MGSWHGMELSSHTYFIHPLQPQSPASHGTNIHSNQNVHHTSKVPTAGHGIGFQGAAHTCEQNKKTLIGFNHFHVVQHSGGSGNRHQAWYGGKKEEPKCT